MRTPIEQILEPKEQVIWQGVINRKALTFNLIIVLIVIALISMFFFRQDIINYTSNEVPKEMKGYTLGLIVLIAGLLITFLNFFQNIVKKYAITKKRVIIKSGIIGTDFKSIYYNEIKSSLVVVGLIGKIFKVGTIKIDLGETEISSTSSNRKGSSHTSTSSHKVYEELKYINNPYEIYKYFQSSTNERLESLYSGRADRENNPRKYK
jgi:uncharacterized membrane protein YdbT with pleckstrin-like domain